MPTYESDEITRDKLYELRRRNQCQECGGPLDVFLDWNTRKAYLACKDFNRTHHEGMAKEYREPRELNIETRREQMEQEHGSGMSTALDRARIPTTGALTQPQAMHILKLVYPDVPEDEIIRTAIFCRDFGLHPLAKEVFIIPFGNKFSMVVGIPASRKLAHAVKGEFSYLDDTPRTATQEEIIKQYGKNSEEERDNLISVTLLKGERGNLAIGFGLFPKAEKPKGMEKGNSKRNMANIRSERPAMDRLPGKALPKYEVIDEAYTELPDTSKLINKTTGEIIEAEARVVTEAPMQPAYGICPIHNIPLVAGKGVYGPYCPTRVDGIGRSAGKQVWCKGKLPPGQAATPSPEPSPEPEPEYPPELDYPPDGSGKELEQEDRPEAPPAAELVGFVNKAWLVESLDKLKATKPETWGDENILTFMKNSYKVEEGDVLGNVAKMDKNAATHFTKMIEKALG